MEHRALQHALEAQSWLGFALFVVLGNQRRGGVDELLQIMAQLVEIGSTGAQHAGRRLVIQQGQQQVLDRHELMTLGARLLESQIEGDFELSIQHSFTSYPSGRH